jgi:hypothetical protein
VQQLSGTSPPTNKSPGGLTRAGAYGVTVCPVRAAAQLMGVRSITCEIDPTGISIKVARMLTLGSVSLFH